MFTWSWPTHSVPTGRLLGKSNDQKRAWGMGSQNKVWLFQCSATWYHTPVKQSGNLVQVTGDPLPRSLPVWVLQNLAYVTVLSCASILDLLLIMPKFLSLYPGSVFSKGAGNPCRPWGPSISRTGLCVLGSDLPVLVVQLNSWRETWFTGSLKHPWAASMVPCHPRGSVAGSCSFPLPLPTAHDEPAHYSYDHRLCSTLNISCAFRFSSITPER